MIEFDVDMGYLLEAGELDSVVLNDENGEHEPMEFRPSGGECECDGTIEWRWTGPTTYYEHELSCGHVITSVDNEPPKFCEECGAKIRKAVERC